MAWSTSRCGDAEQELSCQTRLVKSPTCVQTCQYIYICILYKYIYTHNQHLLSSYADRKQVSWFLICFEMFWKFCYQIQSQDLSLLHIFLFEMQGQIPYLIHCRVSYAWNTKLNSVTVTPGINLLECLKVVFCHFWLQS